MPLFPEREKVRGPAFGREPCIDDRLPLPCALAKEKMPAEWLLNFKCGLLFCTKSSCPFISDSTNPSGSPRIYNRSKVDDKAEFTKSYINDGTVVKEGPRLKK